MPLYIEDLELSEEKQAELVQLLLDARELRAALPNKGVQRKLDKEISATKKQLRQLKARMQSD